MEKETDKELSFQDKVLKMAKDNLIIMMMGGTFGGYATYKEYTEEDKQTAFKVEVVHVVKTDLRHYLDSLMDERFMINLEKSLDNPMIWYDALSSDYVSEYAEEKAVEIRTEVQEKLIEMDSIQKGFIESIGKSLGVRDEDVLPLFEKMMRDYVKKNSIRTVELPPF